jgi:hypothetical protein
MDGYDVLTRDIEISAGSVTTDELIELTPLP